MGRNTWLTRRSALKTGAIAAGVTGVTTGTGAARDDESSPDDHCYYQVDLVAGDPIETLGANEDAFYGRQNRLVQYVHADGDEVIERDTWLNSLDPEIRRCVTADPIRIADGTASVGLTVADGCERTLSLAVYPLPDGEFSFGSRQTLADAATGTFAPGTHELTVDLSSVGCRQRSDGYDQVAKLVADDPGPRFGYSVAASGSGDTVVVGDPFDDDVGTFSGAAYVFERTDGTWHQRTQLVSDDTAEGDRFGWSVAVSDAGDTAVVGAPFDMRDDAGPLAGAAYVFERADGTWVQRARLTVADAVAGDQFGSSVAVSSAGDTAVVGAPSDEVADVDSGSASVFVREDGTWSQRAKLVSDDAVTGDEFGNSVAVSDSGDTVVVGMPSDGDDDRGLYAGSAYVFVRSEGGWIQQAKLTAADAAAVDNLGRSVGVSGSGDTAVAGAPFDMVSGLYSGSAYVFGPTSGTWTQRAKLTADDPVNHSQFGWSVAVSGPGDTTVVGAGGAYVFVRKDETWSQRAKLTADDRPPQDHRRGGVAVSDSGDTVFVGALRSTGDVGRAGAVYVFET